MADKTYYVHDNGIYGVSIDTHPGFAVGPKYIPCDLQDLDELRRQRAVLYERIKEIKKPFKKQGSKLQLIGWLFIGLAMMIVPIADAIPFFNAGNGWIIVVVIMIAMIVIGCKKISAGNKLKKLNHFDINDKSLTSQEREHYGQIYAELKDLEQRIIGMNIQEGKLCERKNNPFHKYADKL